MSRSVHAHQFVSSIPVNYAMHFVSSFQHIFGLHLMRDLSIKLSNKNYFYFPAIVSAYDSCVICLSSRFGIENCLIKNDKLSVLQKENIGSTFFSVRVCEVKCGCH